jgi:hypothetical protein
VILGIVCGAVAAAAAGDGVTTVRFVKRGCHEVGIMKYLYGFAKDGYSYPKTWQVVVYGGLVIAAEIAIALTTTHYHPEMRDVFVGGGLFQVGVHIYEMIHNELLKC